jgi:hypothetical protein
MPDRVYIETTFVSYLTARPSRDVVFAGHQLVLDEAGAGDRQAAEERLEVLNDMAILETTPEALALAKELIHHGALPAKAADDALHIAIAATNGVHFLLTWNCRHLANATMRPSIEAVCAARGLKAPIICTPEELLEVKP